MESNGEHPPKDIYQINLDRFRVGLPSDYRLVNTNDLQTIIQRTKEEKMGKTPQMGASRSLYFNSSWALLIGTSYWNTYE